MSNDPNNWPEIERYMNLSAEERRAEDRAKYKYLPTPGLLESAGYWEEFIGLWQHRPLPAKWPLCEVHFYSQSGTCLIGYADRPNQGFQRAFTRVVTDDEQLLQFLREHNWPAPPLPAPVAPADVKLLRRILAEPKEVYQESKGYTEGLPDRELRQMLQELFEAGFINMIEQVQNFTPWAKPTYFPGGTFELTDAGRRYLQHYAEHT